MKLPRFDSSPLGRLTLLYFGLAAALPLLVYIAVQQNYRQSANDPQTQIANDAWGAIAKDNQPPSSVVSGKTVDLSYSQSPFLIVYGANRQIEATNAVISGKSVTIAPPSGSFDAAKQGRNMFTWEPSTGGRYAAVLQYTGDAHPGYVLAARSLYDVEVRENNLAQMAAAVFIALIVLGLAVLVVIR